MDYRKCYIERDLGIQMQKINVIKSKWYDSFPQDVYIDALKELGLKVSINDKEMNNYDYILFETPRSDTVNSILKAVRTESKIIYIDDADDPFFRNVINLIPKNFKRELLIDYNDNLWNDKTKKESFVWCAVGIPNKNVKIKPFETLYSYTKFKYYNKYRRIVAKTELNIKKRKNTYPFSLNTQRKIPRISPEIKKDIDISLMMTTSSPLRREYAKEIIRICKKKKYNYEVWLNKEMPLSYRVYSNYLSRSKVSVAIEGVGYDTYRYWEIPAHRTAMLSTNIGKKIYINNNFEDKKEAYFFDKKEDIEGALEDLIENKKWEDIGEEGYKKYNKFHTPLKRMEYVLKMIG